MKVLEFVGVLLNLIIRLSYNKEFENGARCVLGVGILLNIEYYDILDLMCQLPKRGCNAILFWQHPQMNNEATRASALAYVAAVLHVQLSSVHNIKGKSYRYNSTVEGSSNTHRTNKGKVQTLIAYQSH